MATYTPNYNLYKPDSTDDFKDFRAEFNTNMDTIDANLGGGGGGGSGGHTIIDPLGQNMPSRTGLQFIGANVTDDSVNNKTVVTITGGGGVHYSTSEQIIGTWIDGKPLYEIVVVIPNTSVINNAFTYPHGILNIEFARITNATTFDTSGNAFDLPLINNDGTNLGARLTATDIIFRGTGSLNVNNNRNLYITIQYTKTTD